jgi:hypothetical protein
VDVVDTHDRRCPLVCRGGTGCQAASAEMKETCGDCGRPRFLEPMHRLWPDELDVLDEAGAREVLEAPYPWGQPVLCNALA